MSMPLLAMTAVGLLRKNISLPAMSMPSLAVTAVGLLRKHISSPAMSTPLWRDRHLACFQL